MVQGKKSLSGDAARRVTREKPWGIPVEGETGVEVQVVTAWDPEEIVSLYRSAGWWQEGRDDPGEIGALIQGSLVFVVAVDRLSGKAIGMGRAISDGVSDAYIQDLVVLPGYRGRGIGKVILRRLLDACHERRIRWIALIAEGGSGDFYRQLGFRVEEGDLPMMYHGGEDGGGDALPG
jgi:ribosomal protein S18 acetylase RimI-like enzyme